MTTPRGVTKIVQSQLTSDGAGVTLRRSIGTQALSDLDPFLMLDAFGTDNPDDYIAGFPSHPHRGFETVTYMIAGLMRHKDNTGAEGVMGPGAVQWMTAGRGIVHSEMPEQTDGAMHGFQLWVNLPAKDKMCPPRYQYIEPGDMPVTTTKAGATIKVIAGTVAGKGEGAPVTGPISGIAVEPLYLDITLAPGASHTQPIPAAHSAFAYVFDGEVDIAGTPVGWHNLAVLGKGGAVTLTSKSGGRTLLVAGRPLGEPIARYGPFVMNTEAQIRQGKPINR